MNENHETLVETQSPIEFSVEQRKWIEGKNFFPESLTLKTANKGDISLKVLERDADGHILGVGKRTGHKGFVLKVEDPDGRELAAKLCLKADYTGSHTASYETQLAIKLEDAPVFVVPREVGEVTLTLDNSIFKSDEWVCFLIPWVEGKTLRQILEDDPSKATPQLIITVARNLLDAVYHLREKKLKHDDMHSGNVMLAPKIAARFSREGKNAVDVKIIDTGSLKPIENPTDKIHDDRVSFLAVLVDLYNSIFKNRLLASQYPRFVRLFHEFIMQMAESNPSRYFPAEDDIADKLSELEVASRSEIYKPTGTFNPFDAISAEHLSSDSILVQLFEDNLPWFGALSANDPNVLTGPRGCGKSMAFRYLSARTHLLDSSSARSALEEMPFLGIYISCSIELQNNLMAISREDSRVTKSSSSIETYFQLVLLKEFFKTLASLSEKLDLAAIYGLNEAVFNKTILFLEERISSAFTFSGVGLSGRLHAIVDQLEALRYGTAHSLRVDEPPPLNLVVTFVAELIDHVASTSNGFNGRKVCFMLDDYTDHRIKPNIQRVLNKIIWDRRPHQIFKISAEKYGFVSEDIDGLRLDVFREFSPIDTGDAYLSQKTDPVEFVTSLLDRRLQASKWVGRTDNIIGHSKPKSDQDLANLIRDQHKPGKTFHYHGIEMISRLLCGDVATLIQVVREVFKRGNVTATSTNLVPSSVQNAAIVDVSKALVERIQSHYPHGLEMHKIATEFGGLVRDIQINGRLISISDKNDKNPARLLQIELTNANPNTILEQLAEINPELRSLAQELIRSSIFIERSIGGAKEGAGYGTVRWHFRRMLLPYFKTALRRWGYVSTREIEDLSRLLTDPSGFRQLWTTKYNENLIEATPQGSFEF